MATADGQVGAAGAQNGSRRSVEGDRRACDPISSADPNPVSTALESWREMLQTRPENAPWNVSWTAKPERAVLPAKDDTAELWIAIETLKNRLDEAEHKFAAAEQELIAQDYLKQSQQQAANDRNRLRQVERALVELQVELTRARVQREKAESSAAIARTQAATAKAQAEILTAQLALRSINGGQLRGRSVRS